MLRIHTTRLRIAASALFGAGTIALASTAAATSNGLADWRATYPNSNSDDAGCQLCHGSSTGQLNAYGRDICLAFEA